MPSSSTSAPASASAGQEPPGRREVGVAGLHEDDERGPLRGLRLREGPPDASHSETPSRRATDTTSLSPRPERFTRSAALFGRRGASAIAQATACAVSSAGMMPSVSARRWNAAQRRPRPDGDVPRPPELGQARVLGPDRRIVEARGHGMRREHLPVRVLQDERARAVEDADRARAEARGVLAGREASPSGLDAHHLDLGERKELPEEADRVRAAADARDEDVRQLPERLRLWTRASRPMTAWKSRTIVGNGCGPRTDPRM